MKGKRVRGGGNTFIWYGDDHRPLSFHVRTKTWFINSIPIEYYQAVRECDFGEYYVNEDFTFVPFNEGRSNNKQVLVMWSEYYKEMLTFTNSKQ